MIVTVSIMLLTCDTHIRYGMIEILITKYTMSYSYQKSFNAILNALPKDQRRDYKLANIAAADRQQTGTPSFREYNEYTSPGTVAPTEGRPWTKP